MLAAAPFNSDLYVVAATAIPVFMVALMIEGSFIVKSAAYGLRKLFEPSSPGPWTWKRLLGIVSSCIGQLGLFAAVLLGVVSVIGEVSAVLALDRRHASEYDHRVVLSALIILPIATAVGALISTAIHVVADFMQRSKDSNKPTDDAPTPDSPDC